MKAVAEPRVAVVIVNYHSAAWVARCIESIQQQCSPCPRIVVVDHSEPAETATLERNNSEVAVVENPGNPGFAAGCNRGIEWALARHFDYLLLLNPDTRMESDALSPLVASLESDPTAAIAGPKLVQDDARRRLLYAGGRLNWWLGGPRHIRRERGGCGDPPMATDFVSGCAMLLRSSALAAVGPLDETYFLYFEDADYVLRMRDAGWRALYVSAATVLHTEAATLSRRSFRHAYLYSRNRLWFMRRWARWYHQLLLAAYSLLIKAPGALIWLAVVRRNPAAAAGFLSGLAKGLVARVPVAPRGGAQG